MVDIQTDGDNLIFFTLFSFVCINHKTYLGEVDILRNVHDLCGNLILSSICNSNCFSFLCCNGRFPP